MLISTTVLILSPHYDDAVLSCANHINQWRDKGHNVVIASIFTKGQRARSLENHRALKELGAQEVSLDFADSPERFKKALRYSHLISWPTDPQLVSQLAREIERLNNEIKPILLVGPLSLGMHVDHRLTMEALLLVHHKKKLFYEDKPYSLIPEHMSILLNKEIDSSELFWKRYFSTGYIRTLCNLEEEMKSVQKIVKSFRSTFDLELKIESTTLNNPEKVKRAILCYKSQLSSLFPDEGEYNRLYSLPEKLWELTCTERESKNEDVRRSVRFPEGLLLT